MFLLALFQSNKTKHKNYRLYVKGHSGCLDLVSIQRAGFWVHGVVFILIFLTRFSAGTLNLGFFLLFTKIVSVQFYILLAIFYRFAFFNKHATLGDPPNNSPRPVVIITKFYKKNNTTAPTPG